jgi:hypothetical protein
VRDDQAREPIGEPLSDYALGTHQRHAARLACTRGARLGHLNLIAGVAEDCTRSVKVAAEDIGHLDARPP